MFEPVTMTRSATPSPGAGTSPVYVAPGGGAVVVAGRSAPPGASGPPGGGGARNGAGGGGNEFDEKIKGNPTLATRAMRTNPNLFSTFFIISFSIGLVGFRRDYPISEVMTSFSSL